MIGPGEVSLTANAIAGHHRRDSDQRDQRERPVDPVLDREPPAARVGRLQRQHRHAADVVERRALVDHLEHAGHQRDLDAELLALLDQRAAARCRARRRTRRSRAGRRCARSPRRDPRACPAAGSAARLTGQSASAGWSPGTRPDAARSGCRPSSRLTRCSPTAPAPTIRVGVASSWLRSAWRRNISIIARAIARYTAPNRREPQRQLHGVRRADHGREPRSSRPWRSRSP